MGTLTNSEDPDEMQHYAKVLLSECLTNLVKKQKREMPPSHITN